MPLNQSHGTSALKKQKPEVAHRTISAELPVEGKHGLISGTARILGVSEKTVKSAHSSVVGISLELWNERILSNTAESSRAQRKHTYPRGYIYRYFHNELDETSEEIEPLPDTCIPTEPNKGIQKRRVGRKKVLCAGKWRKFACTHKIRKVWK